MSETETAPTEASASPTSARADRDALRVVGAAIAAALVAILYYAIDRSRAFIMHGPPDPLSPFASQRIDYFWRVAIAFFLGSLAWAGWSALIGDRAERGFALLTRAVVPVVALAVLLSLLFP